MKEIFDKISSYNFFNYLFPGFIYSVVYEHYYGYKIVEGDVIIQLFISYLIGMIISRIGSLFIEPVLRKTKFLKFATYHEFIQAEKKDSKIEVLSEINNTYRTLTSMCILIILTILGKYISICLKIDQSNNFVIIILMLLFLFLFSYRKQTNYITSRIRSLISQNTKNSIQKNKEE